MIKKILTSFLFFLILSCSGIELVLKEGNSQNILKNNVLVIETGEEKERYANELYSFFGSNKNSSYILLTSFVEKKENRIVKNNQVAQKTDYELTINYELFYKNRDCKILNKKIITKFTTSPKSFGYNFGADRSFEKLYTSSIKKNIQTFIRSLPIGTNCLK